MNWFKRLFNMEKTDAISIPDTNLTLSQSNSFDDKSRNDIDILDSGKSQFIATLCITTPFAVLRHHGEIFNDTPSNAPKYGEQGEGFWQFKPKTVINTEEFGSSTCMTDIGLQNSDTYLPFLLSFRDIFESKDKDDNKIRRFGTLVSSNLKYENFWEQLKAKYQDFPLCLFYNSLLDLPGVGRKTARNLYEAGFCSIEQVKNATQSELQKVSGVGKRLAKKRNPKIQLEPQEISAVRSLATLLNEREPLSEDEKERLYKPYGQRAVRQMLKSGNTYGEVTGAPGTAINTSDEGEFRDYLHSIDNDLLAQVKIVREGINHYFKNGEIPAPYYAWRISVIIRKANEYELEASFLEGFTKHFRNGVGARYAAIAERAVKARELASYYHQEK